MIIPYFSIDHLIYFICQLNACRKIIVDKMLGQNAVQEIENAPLSESTISRRIDDMSHDVEEIMCDKLKNSSFSIQIDESTDIASKCHVVTFIRFFNEGEIQENLFCCKKPPETSKEIDIFNIVLISRNKRSLLEGLCWHLY